MNFLTKIHPLVRKTAYYVYAIGAVIMVYLGAKHIVGVDEATLYVGIGGVLGLTAGSNVQTPESDDEG